MLLPKMFEFNSTIQSNASTVGLQAKDKEYVSRELAQALARSVAAISRSNSRENSRQGSPEKSRSPTKGSGLAAESVIGVHSPRMGSGHAPDSVFASGANYQEEDQNLEKSECMVRSLQEAAKRRMRELDRLHATKPTGPTLYNPSAYQPRGAALSTKVSKVSLCGPLQNHKKTAKAGSRGSKKGPSLAIWRHELELLEADLQTLATKLDDLDAGRRQKIQAWEKNLREREQAIEAFQTKEFIDFALTSAQTAQQITHKEEELRAEEELLNQEKRLMMENIEDMKKIRAQLEIQHRCVENSKRLDVPAELREPQADAKAEQLRVWEVNLQSREHAMEQRELDVARKVMDIQERERHVQIKYMTMQELKVQMHTEFSSWEDDLIRREKRAGSARSPPERCSADDKHIVAGKELDDVLDNLRKGLDKPRRHLSELTQDLFNQEHGSSTSAGSHSPRAASGYLMGGDGSHELHLCPNKLHHQGLHSPKKFPQYLCRRRQVQALNASLQHRGKENALLGVDFA